MFSYQKLQYIQLQFTLFHIPRNGSLGENFISFCLKTKKRENHYWVSVLVCSFAEQLFTAGSALLSYSVLPIHVIFLMTETKYGVFFVVVTNTFLYLNLRNQKSALSFKVKNLSSQKFNIKKTHLNLDNIINIQSSYLKHLIQVIQSI